MEKSKYRKTKGISLTVQWLRLGISIAGGLIPGQGTKILHALWHSQEKNKQINKNKTQIAFIPNSMEKKRK